MNVERIPFKTPLAALVLALVIGTGCTSDPPNGVGRGLTDIGLDSTLVELTLWEPTSYGVLDVTNGAKPLDENEVLYLGSDGGLGQDDTNASSILVTFDFSTLPDDLWTQELLQASNIVSVQLQLQMLKWYFPNHGARPPDPPDPSDPSDPQPPRFWSGARKFYDVHLLDVPLDTLSYPGPEPSYINEPRPVHVVQPELEAADGPVFVDLEVGVVAGWLAAGERVSLIVREGAGSEPGLLGFASKEMAHGGSTLPALRPDASLGPTLIIDTTLYPDALPDSLSNLVVRPVADVSTWHVVEAPPATIAEGLLFRTHLRSYPAVGFNLSALPPNVRINRAELTLVTDTTRTAGPAHVLVASEVRTDFVPTGVTSVALADIEPEVFVVDGRTGLDPSDDASDIIAINVTSSVQRFLNDAYVGSRVFLLTEGESFMTGFRTNPSPDFWFRRRFFYGTADPDSAKRPRLKVIYSRENELVEAQP
jgi:hypothetical protein